jgi:hypothetical protein
MEIETPQDEFDIIHKEIQTSKEMRDLHTLATRKLAERGHNQCNVRIIVEIDFPH